MDYLYIKKCQKNIMKINCNLLISNSFGEAIARSVLFFFLYWLEADDLIIKLIINNVMLLTLITDICLFK